MVKYKATSHQIDYLAQVQDLKSLTLVKTLCRFCRTGKIVFQSTHKFLSWRTSLLGIVMEIEEGGSAINGATPSSFYGTG